MKIVVCSLLGLLLVVGSAEAQQRQQKAANVVVQPLQFSPMKLSIETVGTAEAKKSVSIYPAVADKVTKVLFTPGDFVEQGQTLIELDARRQHTALTRAQIELADAERTLKRLIKSKTEGAVTQSAVDDAITLRDLAEVAVQEAQDDLQDRQVVSPFSGYVGLTDVEPGDRIGVNTLITTIDDRTQLFINFSAPELALGLVDKNAQVEVQPWNNRELALTANLAELDSRIDTEDRTLKVRAILDNDDDRFRPGLSFKVTLTAAGASYPTIPEAALAWGATGSYVWVNRGGQAVKENVEIKQRLRGEILVEGNLQQQDILIVEGIQQLRSGQPVKTDMLISAKQ
ncbi:MAG: efflux RND transporter periplasmic adaptor subunit [Aestuariibacter sp.]